MRFTVQALEEATKPLAAHMFCRSLLGDDSREPSSWKLLALRRCGSGAFARECFREGAAEALTCAATPHARPSVPVEPGACCRAPADGVDGRMSHRRFCRWARETVFPAFQPSTRLRLVTAGMSALQRQ